MKPVIQYRPKATSAAGARSASPTQEELYKALAHGDDVHRDWLKRALEALYSGGQIPEPVSGKDYKTLYEGLLKAEMDRKEKLRLQVARSRKKKYIPPTP